MAHDKDVGVAAIDSLPDIDTLLPIVVGARLEAELTDRPLAYRLAGFVRERLLLRNDPPLVPVVCSDLWYLNDESLRGRPTITIGDPDVNAATAFLAGRLPTAFVIEGSLRIQLDLELLDLRACLWGTNPRATAACGELFIERYLDDFLRAAVLTAAPE